jgi:FkbM family methyltransferase
MRVRVQWRVRSVISKTSIVKVDGVRIALDTKDSLDRLVLREGHFESDLLVCRRLLSSISCLEKSFVDVGANTGHWTLALARDFGTVHSFEPDPSIHASLQINVRLNDFRNINLNQLALSNAMGSAYFYRRPALDNSGARNSGMGSIVVNDNLTTEAIPVNTSTLDYERPRLRVGLIKIDVEGAENLVLSGSQSVLKEDRPAVVHEFLVTGSNHVMTDLQLRLSLFPESYRHFAIPGGGTQLEKVSLDNPPAKSLNIFSLPLEMLEQLSSDFTVMS